MTAKKTKTYEFWLTASKEAEVSDFTSAPNLKEARLIMSRPVLKVFSVVAEGASFMDAVQGLCEHLFASGVRVLRVPPAFVPLKGDLSVSSVLAGAPKWIPAEEAVDSPAFPQRRLSFGFANDQWYLPQVVAWAVRHLGLAQPDHSFPTQKEVAEADRWVMDNRTRALEGEGPDA